MPNDLDPIRAAALRELRHSPVAAAWWRSALGVAAVHVLVATVVMVIASWSRHPRAGEPVWLLGAVLLTAVVVGGVLAALRPEGRGSRRAVVALSALTLVVLSSTTTGWRGSTPFLHDADCALVELAVSLVPMFVMARSLAQFAFAPTRALVGGLAAGATGLWVLHLSCPVGDAAHWLAFHGGPYLLIAPLTLALRARSSSRSHAP